MATWGDPEMNPMKSGTSEDLSLLKWCGLVVLMVLALTLAIRTESFWTDELSSAFLASQNTWQHLVSCLGSLGSEAQMPLHIVWLWFWSRFFETGEWALRAANIPWAILAVVSWIGLLRKGSYGMWATGLLISPFICYYMNEARPYVMTFATSMLALYALESLCAVSSETCGSKHTVALVVGIGLCVGASMLNLILVPSLIAYLMMRLSGASVLKGWRNLMRYNLGTLGNLLVLLGGIAAYYLFTLVQGHGGQREPFTWINASYAIYEMLGFGGLGAPRILLRELSVASVLSRYGTTLVLGLIVWCLVVAVMWLRRREILQDPIVRAAWTGLVVGILALAGSATFFKVSLWGRHFMVVMPLLLLGLAGALDAARKGAPLASKLSLLVLIGLFAVSSVRQRGLDDYRKDPLREAVAELREIIRQSPSKPVVMVSSPLALWYYGEDMTFFVTPVFGWSDARSRRWQSVHSEYVILVHRADKFDPQGNWTSSLGTAKAKLLWQSGNIKIYHINADAGSKGLL